MEYSPYEFEAPSRDDNRGKEQVILPKVHLGRPIGAIAMDAA